MSRVALAASTFVLPLDDINPRTVADAMAAGIDLHEDGGAVWSAPGMSALLWLRERAEVIITDTPAALADMLLGWGVGVTGNPLASMSGVACTIDYPPLMLNEAAATSALEAP